MNAAQRVPPTLTSHEKSESTVTIFKDTDDTDDELVCLTEKVLKI